MNGKCLDIGTIQAFLDGETRPEDAVMISDHVADCDACTILLAQAEEESSLVFSVLDRELNTLVPTQRLWNRINAEIAEEKSHASIWQRFLGAITTSLMSPSFAGAAGILLIAGLLSVVWLNRQASTPGTDVALSDQIQQPAAAASVEPQTVEVAVTGDGPVVTAAPASKPQPTVVRSTLSDAELKRMVITANHVEQGPKKTYAVPAAAPRYLPGEESYIKTINELQQSITAQNASMKASGQVAFQRDLAVVDDAIAKMRSVVQKNPRNQAARQILYSSYQDKIELLRTSAQRDELVASLQ
jgi:hypothetical protein